MTAEHTEEAAEVRHALRLQDSKLWRFDVCVHDNVISRQSNLWSTRNDIILDSRFPVLRFWDRTCYCFPLQQSSC